jgi:predicted Zn-dependent protease
MYPEAEIKLKASIQKDPAFMPALRQLTILQYRNMLYRDALKNILKCLQFDTEDGESNYYYGLINISLGNETDAIDGFSIATLSDAFRSAAYLELAKLNFKKTDYEKAVQYVNSSIDFNSNNIDGWLLKAVAMRKNGLLTEAENTLQTILKKDPLNHFVRFEQYLLHTNQESYNHFTSLIRNELPDETYTSMAVWYYKIGCIAEAKALFKIIKPNPESVCWLAFLNNEKAKLDNVSPLFAFPFRPETAMVMEKLLQKQNDWMLRYQLALIYRNFNRIDECRNLLLSCNDTPNFAPFYAVRASVENIDSAQSERDLVRANNLENKDWRYKKLLAEYYIQHHQLEKALSITDDYYRKNPSNYIMGLLCAKALVLNEKYSQADKILSEINIIPFEGATEGHVLYRKIKLMLALNELKEKKYERAKYYIQQAQLWSENLGVGKPYDADIDSRLENYLFYLTEKNKKSEAAQLYLKKITSFNPATDNTIDNFYASNALVSALAISQVENKESAFRWLQQQENSFPRFTQIFEWSRNVIDGNKNAAIPDRIIDGNSDILLSMQKMGLL